jgi:YegS/Rv2252/BmrU family lipid kinase
MPARTLFIVNPASRNGALGRRWPDVERRLRDGLGRDFDVERTRGPRDAVRIAREAARAGADCIVGVGGDGTAHEVVSGVLQAGLGESTQVGLLPFGTGGDLSRTLGIPRDVEQAVARLASGKVRRIDAGRAEFTAADGRPATAWFVNIASFGLSGLVTQKVNSAPKALGGRGSFLVGTLRGLAAFRASDVTLRVDGTLLHEGPLVFATAANGRYFGGGMHVAPQAVPDDGLLDVVAVRAAPRSRLLRQIPGIYKGTHLDQPEVSVARGARIEADAEPGQVWIELDGEPLGTLPARFDVLPGALAWIGAEA